MDSPMEREYSTKLQPMVIQIFSRFIPSIVLWIDIEYQGFIHNFSSRPRKSEDSIFRYIFESEQIIISK